jgi:Mtf2 family
LSDVNEPKSSNSNKKSVGLSSRRQGITARETKVLTGMLDMIFDSNNRENSNSPLGDGQAVFKKGKVDDFFVRLRRHSKDARWMDELDANKLDQKKEQIGYCNSDQELLDWAIREVFEESKQFEAAARAAIAEAAISPGLKEPPPLQPATYPYMIPILMRTFRDKYHDPHLALSIFNYAKSLSIVSYVFGCSTEAYNELVQTKWECFRDLPGVYQSVNEMIINGVPFNTRTRKWVETVRRDVVGQRVRLDMNEASQNEVWQLLSNMDRTIANNDAQQGSKARWESWKYEVMRDNKTEDDSWSFDNWSEMFKSRQSYQRPHGARKGYDAVRPRYNF